MGQLGILYYALLLLEKIRRGNKINKKLSAGLPVFGFGRPKTKPNKIGKDWKFLINALTRILDLQA